MAIVLSPELERAVTDRALQQGTTPELLIRSLLNENYLNEPPVPTNEEGKSSAEMFAEYIGSIDSSDVFPEGSDLSQDTGRKFKELMLRKYRPDMA